MLFRKLLYFAIFPIILMFLSGCDPTNMVHIDVSPQPTEDLNKNFRLNLYTDKDNYRNNEQINIWATLEYIGSNDQITIWHGLPYVSFTITDGKRFNAGGTFEDILTSTVLDKGIIYTYNYSKGGGYEENSPDADFWRKFYNQKEMYLPKGYYTIKVQGAFSLSEYGNHISNSLIAETKIRVN